MTVWHGKMMCLQNRCRKTLVKFKQSITSLKINMEYINEYMFKIKNSIHISALKNVYRRAVQYVKLISRAFQYQIIST